MNHALYDGYLLASEIIKHGLQDLHGAVEAYEQEMFPRGIGQVSEAEMVIKMLFDEGAPHTTLKFMMEAEG